MSLMIEKAPNGLRYLRWGGDGEAVQLEKCLGVGNCLRLPQNPQRQVHALLGAVELKAKLSLENLTSFTEFFWLTPFILLTKHT